MPPLVRGVGNTDGLLLLVPRSPSVLEQEWVDMKGEAEDVEPEEGQVVNSTAEDLEKFGMSVSHRSREPL